MQTIDPTGRETDVLQLGDGPFIFSGIPPFCRGNIVISSTSHETLRVGAISTEHREDRKLGPLGFGKIRVQTRIEPGTRRAVPAHFHIDPYTAPGVYKTSIPWGKGRHEVVVHVHENPRLSVSPSRLNLKGAAGDRLSHTLVIHNPGNVTHRLDEVAMVWLEEQDWIGRTAVSALRESPGDETLQAALDRVLAQLRKSMLPAVRVALKYDSPEIRPGDTRVVDIELTLPVEGMSKGRSYLGFIKLMGDRLWMEVTCTGSPASTKRRPL